MQRLTPNQKAGATPSRNATDAIPDNRSSGNVHFHFVIWTGSTRVEPTDADDEWKIMIEIDHSARQHNKQRADYCGVKGKTTRECP
jgi:hypothetical protein